MSGGPGGKPSQVHPAVRHDHRPRAPPLELKFTVRRVVGAVAGRWRKEHQGPCCSVPAEERAWLVSWEMERGQLAPCCAVECPRILNKVEPGRSADRATAIEHDFAKRSVIGHRELRPGGRGRGGMQLPPSVLVERPGIAMRIAVLVSATKEDDLRQGWEVHQWRPIEWRWG